MTPKPLELSDTLSRSGWHAERLCFVHPLTGKRLELHAAIPRELQVR